MKPSLSLFLLSACQIGLFSSLAFSQTPAESKSTQDKATNLFASKWFVKVYGSYHLPLAGSYRPGNTTSFNPPNTTVVNFKSNNQGLGQGWRAGAGIGYIVSEVINLGLDIDQYWSSTIQTSNVMTTPINRYSYESGGMSFSWVSQGKGYYTVNNMASMLAVTPNITFKAISKPKFYIYNRLGVTVGLRNELTESRKDSTAFTATITEFGYTRVENYRQVTAQDYEFKEGIPIGFMASLGIQIRLTEHIRMFAEAQTMNITYSPKYRKTSDYYIVAYQSDGNIQPGLVFTERDRTTDYLNKYSFDADEFQRNPAKYINKPKQEIKFRIPYSSIGLSFGLFYRF
jgi:hypothetical protein